MVEKTCEIVITLNGTMDGWIVGVIIVRLTANDTNTTIAKSEYRTNRNNGSGHFFFELFRMKSNHHWMMVMIKIIKINEFNLHGSN